MTQHDMKQIAEMVVDLVGRQYQSARKSDSEFWGEVKMSLRSLGERAANVDTLLSEIRDSLRTHTQEIDSLRLWRSAITAGIAVILVTAIPLASRAFNSLEKSVDDVKRTVNMIVQAQK